jgi:hypothetical protein
LDGRASRLLRAGELSVIDAANIAEEIESMGRSDRRELKSRPSCWWCIC